MTLRGPSQLMPHEELLTIRDVARRLRVNENTVRRWMRDKSLAAILLPQRTNRRHIYRVKQSTLDAMLKPSDSARKDRS